MMQTTDVRTLTAAQEIFDYVAAHLAGMDQQSKRTGMREDYDPSDDTTKRVEGEACAYRGDEGRMCAIGALLTDEEIKVGDQTVDTYRYGLSTSVRTLEYDGHLPARLVPHLDLLSALQGVHDDNDAWTGEWDDHTGLVDYGFDRLRETAVSFHLDPSKVEELRKDGTS